jgi:3' exoribonuclease, RNase T-like
MHVMLDLETLSTAANAAIVQIGAVAFTAEGIGDSFFAPVDLETVDPQRFSISAGTVKWWLRQSDAARAPIAAGGQALPAALKRFAEWLAAQGPQNELRVWGNGAAFDNVVLRTAYSALSILAPWCYTQDRCFRTVKAMFPLYTVPDGTCAHNALSDAKWQAAYLCLLHRHHGVLRHE